MVGILSFPRVNKSGVTFLQGTGVFAYWAIPNLLEAMANESHPEREMYLEWLGGELDPEAFDLAEINEILQEM